MGKYRQVLQRQVGGRQWERDKLSRRVNKYTRTIRILISWPAVRPDEGFFYNRGRGPIRFEVLNPFISYAMMHDSLSSEQIKGALNPVARIRWNDDYTGCAVGITKENKFPTVKNFT